MDTMTLIKDVAQILAVVLIAVAGLSRITVATFHALDRVVFNTLVSFSVVFMFLVCLVSLGVLFYHAPLAAYLLTIGLSAYLIKSKRNNPPPEGCCNRKPGDPRSDIMANESEVFDKP